MKVEVAFDELKQAVDIVKETVGKDSGGHQGIRIYASKKTNRIKLTTADGHYMTDHWINASVKEGGSVVIKAKMFIDYVKKLDVEKATLTKKDNEALQVKTKRGQQTFTSFSPQTFQVPPKVKSSFSFDIAGRVFKNLVQSVSFAADVKKNTQRPILEGIHLFSNGKILELSTTNGLTVAHIRKKLKSKKIDVVLGPKALVNSARVVKDDDKVTVQACDNNRFVLKVKDTTYHMPTLAGAFPDIKSVLPGMEFPLRFDADRDELLGILDRASLMLDGKGTLHFEEGKVTLSGKTEESDFSEYITTNLQGKSGDVKVDVKKMTEIVKHIDADIISIGVQEKKPITLRPEGRTSHTCILAVG